MKIQLDTTNKTIKIEEHVKISKLIEVLKQMLPSDWKNFTLETNTTISYWNSPIVIKEYPSRPWYEQPWISYKSKDTLGVNLHYKEDMDKEKYSLKSGVYNVEA